MVLYQRHACRNCDACWVQCVLLGLVLYSSFFGLGLSVFWISKLPRLCVINFFCHKNIGKEAVLPLSTFNYIKLNLSFHFGVLSFLQHVIN